MEQKTKFIIIGLLGFALVCLFLFMQAQSSKQVLSRERDDLKTENTSLSGKVDKLEDDLRSNQNKISSLQGELSNLSNERNDLQAKFDVVNKAREDLVAKLKSRMEQESATNNQIQVPPNSDAYWAGILKAKTDLEMQLDDVRGILKTLKNENESLQRDKGSLQVDINSLRNDKNDLTRQLDYNKKLLDSMAQEVVRERNDKVKIQDSFKTIKNENEVLGRQLKSINGRKSDLDRKLQDLQDSKSSVDRRLSEMETMLTDKIAQIDNLKDQLDAIRAGKPVPPTINAKPRESVELPAIVVHSTPADRNQKLNNQGLLGRVLAINQDNKFVVIDIGLQAGVKVGDNFNVYSDGKNIGLITVIQSRSDISACDIKKEVMPIAIGDGIK